MTYLMRISKEGYDAINTSNPDNLVFSSEYGTLKYHASGSISLVASGSSVETSVTHGLGYVPFFIVYYRSPTNTARHSMTPQVFQGFGGIYSFIEAYADTSKIYFTIHTNTLNATILYYYKIFRNSLGL